MRRASTARASRACVPTYTASPSPEGTTHHHGADPSAGASLSRGAIAPLDGSSVHVAAVPSMDVDTTRSGRPVAASGGIVASARTAPACASRSSVTRVGLVGVGVSSAEAWTRLPRSGTPVADGDVGRRARRARGRVRATREGTRRVADVVAREDAAMRDIPPGEGRCRPLAPRVSAQCPATVGFVSEFSARTGETRPVAKPNARRGSRGENRVRLPRRR